jgi:hypothetical protein
MKKIYELHQQAKKIRQNNLSLWTAIAKYSGITLNLSNIESDLSNKGIQEDAQQQDRYIDDPTAALAVNQSGDYLQGIIWGNGYGVVEYEPSEEVLELASMSELKSWFKYATSQLERHCNHSEAGLINAVKPYIYDQGSIGTSGLGAFFNKRYAEGVDDNALMFRSYGVDNMSILEGVNGLVDYVFANHNWRAQRIVAEFAMIDGSLDEKLFSKLPKPIRDAYDKADQDKVFPLVYGFLPREDFNPKLVGRRGYKYKTFWFLDDMNHCEPFFEGDSKFRPIAVGRQIQIRDEVYGRSSGTMLLSSIRLSNFMRTNVIENVEKMVRPALGIFNDAVFGDSAIDTSSGELVALNGSMGAGGNPIFPIYDVGDITPLTNLMLPILKEEITTGFKIDTLLDFSSAKEMTATESMQRFVIRGKALSGMLLQQKIVQEQLHDRCTSLLMDNGLLGINPVAQKERASKAKNVTPERIIPDAVLQVIKSGKKWYKLRYNNELEKLTRTQKVDNLNQMMQGTMAIAQIAPEIKAAIKWYDVEKAYVENTDNQWLMLEEDEYYAELQKQQQMAQAQMALQAGETAARTDNQMAQAEQMRRQ